MLMNKEHLQKVLIPRILFYLTIAVSISALIAWCNDRKSGGDVGMWALIFAFLGWLCCIGYGPYASDAQNRFRSWFLGIALFFSIATLPSCLRRHPDGTADSGFTHLVDLGKALYEDMFGQVPPLTISLERRNEYLGLEKVEFLIITNKSGNGVVPLTGTLQAAKNTFPISLPPVLKPYETVEVRLQNKGRKWFIEKGESLTIECEGYSKPFTVTWQ